MCGASVNISNSTQSTGSCSDLTEAEQIGLGAALMALFQDEREQQQQEAMKEIFG